MKCTATDHHARESSTVIPPITACATTPSGCTSARRVRRRRRGPGGQRGDQARARDEDDAGREQPVAELDPLGERLRLGVRDGHQAAGVALRPRRAAQPGPGDPHDRPGDGDARLRDHGGDRQRAHDARWGGRQAVEQGHAFDARRPGSPAPADQPDRRGARQHRPDRQDEHLLLGRGGTRGEGGAQAVGERRGGQPLRHGGEPARHLVDRHDDPADEHQHQPDQVGDGQRDLGPQACRRRRSPARRTPRSPAARAAPPSPGRRRRAASPTRARSP